MNLFVAVIPFRNCGRAALESAAASLWEQEVKRWRAVFVDDASTDAETRDAAAALAAADDRFRLLVLPDPSGALAARAAALADPRWPDNAVAVFLDADDRLACSGVLTRVLEAYAALDVWLTWGSYSLSGQTALGPYAARVSPAEWPFLRRRPWRMGHLRTMRVGLWRAIPAEYLRDADGRPFTICTDVAATFAAAELAGPRRCRFLPSRNLVYRPPQHDEPQAAAQAVAVEAVSAILRAQPPLRPLPPQPWDRTAFPRARRWFRPPGNALDGLAVTGPGPVTDRVTRPPPGPSPAAPLDVALAVRNDPRRLAVTLEALARSTPAGLAQLRRVFVVNDGGDSPTAVLDAYRGRLPLELLTLDPPSDANRLAACMNLALARATAHRLLKLDADCPPAPDVLELHAAAAPTEALIGLRRLISQDVAETLAPADVDRLADLVTLEDSRLPLADVRAAPWNVSWMHWHGCHVSYPTAALRSVQGWDPLYFGWGADDQDLAARLADGGLLGRWAPEAVVYHLGHSNRLRTPQHTSFNLPRLCRTADRLGLPCPRGGLAHFYASVASHTPPTWLEGIPELYAQAVERAPEGGRLVEVGAFLGRSTACLVVEAINSGKGLAVDVVDPFDGRAWPGYRDHSPALAAGGSCREEFERNLAPVAGRFQVVPLPSLDAAAHYADGSLAFVFLDADHGEAAVRADIRAWRPKLSRGGLLAGHDADQPQVYAAVRAELGAAAEIAGKTWRLDC